MNYNKPADDANASLPNQTETLTANLPPAEQKTKTQEEVFEQHSATDYFKEASKLEQGPRGVLVESYFSSDVWKSALYDFIQTKKINEDTFTTEEILMTLYHGVNYNWSKEDFEKVYQSLDEVIDESSIYEILGSRYKNNSINKFNVDSFVEINGEKFVKKVLKNVLRSKLSLVDPRYNVRQEYERREDVNDSLRKIAEQKS